MAQQREKLNHRVHEDHNRGRRQIPHGAEGREPRKNDSACSKGLVAASNHPEMPVHSYAAAEGEGPDCLTSAMAVALDVYSAEAGGGTPDINLTDQLEVLWARAPRQEMEHQFDVPIDRRTKPETEPKYS